MAARDGKKRLRKKKRLAIRLRFGTLREVEIGLSICVFLVLWLGGQKGTLKNTRLLNVGGAKVVWHDVFLRCHNVVTRREHAKTHAFSPRRILKSVKSAVFSHVFLMPSKA